MTRKIPVGNDSYALVDDEDYDSLICFKWSQYQVEASRATYAIRSIKVDGKWTTEKMHQRITGFKQTDHINHDGLDNRKENLREANASQNGANKPKSRGKYTSSYKGVNWDKQTKKWKAQLRFNKQKIYLGLFDQEIDAARAYNAAAVTYHKQFANINSIGE